MRNAACTPCSQGHAHSESGWHLHQTHADCQAPSVLIQQPSGPVDPQNFLSAGFILAQGGHAKGNLNTVFHFAVWVLDCSLHRKHQIHMRKLDIVVQLVSDPDLSALDPSMIRVPGFLVRPLAMLRFQFKPGFNRIKKVFLIPLDGKVKVRPL